VTDVQTLLRDTFRAHEHLVDGALPLMVETRIRADQRRRRRAWIAVAATAVAVVVAAGAGTFVVQRGSTSSPPASTPRGWRLISTLGLEVAVPSSWTLGGPGSCGPVTTSRFILPGQIDLGCGAVVTPKVTTVAVNWMEAERADGSTGAGATVTRKTVVDGHRATLREFSATDGFLARSLTVPDRDAVVVVTGPDPTLLDQIIATTRVVTVDLHGCNWQVPSDPKWDRPANGPAIAPGEPEAVRVCTYAGKQLIASGLLRGSKAAAIANAIRQAKAGKTPDVPQNCAGRQAEHQHLRLTLISGDKETPLVVHYENCVDRYVASPTGVSEVTETLLMAAMRPLSISWWYNELPTG
jgi:hypothetical protein